MGPQVRSLIDRQGVALAELIFARDLGWIFREQPISDVGIDALAEIVSQGTATGDLIALQLKSGESFFRERTDDGFVFRGDTDHLEYWRRYALPVMLILCSPEQGRCWWQPIDPEQVEITGKGWKTIIHRRNELNESSREMIRSFVESWRSHRLFQVIRVFLQKPLESDLAAHAEELLDPWIREMDKVSLGCLFWGLEVVEYYSYVRLPWLESNILLRGLLWCMNVLVRWNPIDLNARLAKFTFVAAGIRYSAFHVLGIAGLDTEAEAKGLPPHYGLVIRPTEEQRKMLATLYEYLEETYAETERHLRLELTPTQQAMARQAQASVLQASNSGVFNFVDFPEMKAMGWIGQDRLRGAPDSIMEPVKEIERRWREMLRVPELVTMETLTERMKDEAEEANRPTQGLKRTPDGAA